MLRRPTPDLVYRDVVQLATRLLGVPLAAVYEWAPERGVCLLRSSVGWRSRHLTAVPVGEIPTPAGQTLTTGRPVAVPDVATLQVRDALLRSHPCGSALYVALPGPGGPSGLLLLGDTVPRRFTPEEVHVADALASLGGIALEGLGARTRAGQHDAVVQGILRASQEAIAVLDATGQVLVANDPASRILGLAPGPDGRPADLAQLAGDLRTLCARALQGQGQSGVSVRVHRDEDGALDLVVSALPLRAPGGRPWGALVTAADVTPLRRLEETSAHFREILELTTDLVAVTGVPGQGVLLNRAGRQMLGLGPDEDLGPLTLVEVYPPAERARMVNEAFPAAVRDGGWSGETVILGRNGQTTPVSQVILAHRTGDGGVRGFSVIARDISEQKRTESRLLHLASHDPLTGVSNRRRFEDELALRLAEARRYGTRGAVILLDLDGFKEVNDTWGHLAGDALLSWLATVLRGRLREADLVARWGGDEFALLLPHTDGRAAGALARELCEVVRHAALPYEGRPIRVTASLGVALFPDHGATVEDLLAQADRALYRAKARGRDGVELLPPDGDACGEDGRSSWPHRLRAALEHQGFRFHVLPTLDLRSEQITAYELLLRLVGESGEVILPRDFLGAAERSGLMPAIDAWVLRRAVHLIAEEHRRGGDLRIVVNVSGASLVDAAVLHSLERDLRELPVPPGSLAVEVSEGTAVAHLPHAVSFLEELRRLGCRCGLDDFGAGAAPVTILSHLPVDYVKIDGAFVRDHRLVRALVALAQALDKETIAECVAEEETLAALRRYGVTGAQGYSVPCRDLPGALARVVE